MLQRNDKEELREFSESMFFLGDLLSEEKHKQYSYEALTSSVLVDQSDYYVPEEGFEDLGNEF